MRTLSAFSLVYVLNSVARVLNGRFLQTASTSGVFWSIIMAIVGGVSIISVRCLWMSSISCVCSAAVL